MTRLVCDHLACSNHQGPGCFEEGARDEQEPPAGPHVLGDVNSHTSGHLMFSYLRMGKKQALLTEEAGSGGGAGSSNR